MRRINRPELMDEASDPKELVGDLANLERINRFLGGRSLIRRQLDRVLPHLKGGRPLQLLDVATGGGDLPRHVATRFREQGVTVRILAVDRNPITLACARASSVAFPEVGFARCDARRLPLRSGSVDVVLCSLLLHHFGEEEAILLLREMGRVTRHTVIVNDLRRSPTALCLIWLLTRFCGNRMTRYDGPLSVRRAFTPAEMRRLADAAGLAGARVTPQPFYRQALVYEGLSCS
jgi:ubiquinone/menaquinone biosynthesis C-methylase UbiE